MDHIPTPRFPKYSHPEIKCFARPEFSCLNTPHFHEYPASRGWRREAFVDGDFSQGHGDQEVRAFLQEWLYFKLIAAVFGAMGIDVDMDDFTRRSNGQLLLDSRNLIRYLSEFERQFREFDTESQLENIRQVNSALTVAQFFVVRECSMLSVAQVRSQSWPFDSMTSLCFMVLGCTLTFATSRIIQVMPDKTHALEIFKELKVSHDSWGVSKLLYDRMRSDGWCPHRLAQFASGERSVIGMYYASLLSVASDGKTHNGCKVRECRHTTIKEDEYESHHTHAPPHCLSVAPA